MSPSEKKVAFITGGESGIGLEVATELRKTGHWELHIIDINESQGQSTEAVLVPNCRFHVADVNSYDSLSAAFEETFKQSGRIDFVFANAGIVERVDFYERHPAGSIPPPLNQTSVDIDLKSVVNTAYLALHYFRQSPDDNVKNLIMTGSTGSLYPCFRLPMYTSAKHGVMGFNRAIAQRFWREKIRANTICPGVVATNLLDLDEFQDYPEGTFTPVEFIAKTVVNIVEGSDITDVNGRVFPAQDICGQTIEINMRNIYFREQPDWCDDTMKAIMDTTETHSYNKWEKKKHPFSI